MSCALGIVRKRQLPCRSCTPRGAATARGWRRRGATWQMSSRCVVLCMAGSVYARAVIPAEGYSKGSFHGFCNRTMHIFTIESYHVHPVQREH